MIYWTTTGLPLAGHGAKQKPGTPQGSKMMRRDALGARENEPMEKRRTSRSVAINRRRDVASAARIENRGGRGYPKSGPGFSV
jgi:hypothetical protein